MKKMTLQKIKYAFRKVPILKVSIIFNIGGLLFNIYRFYSKGSSVNIGGIFIFIFLLIINYINIKMITDKIY